MKPQQVTNAIILVAVLITLYFIGSSVDKQLASDVNQTPITLTK